MPRVATTSKSMTDVPENLSFVTPTSVINSVDSTRYLTHILTLLFAVVVPKRVKGNVARPVPRRRGLAGVTGRRRGHQRSMRVVLTASFGGVTPGSWTGNE